MPLILKAPFRTAFAERHDKSTLWVIVSHDGVCGWGEAVPMDTYGQTVESAERTLRNVAPALDGPPMNVEHLTNDLLVRYDDQRATVAAVDAALHDWIGKKHRVAVCRWLGLNPDSIPLTSLTIGLDEPEAMAEKAARAASFPILKIKLGTPQDEEILTAIRRVAPNTTLRVDANMAWRAERAEHHLRLARRFDVEFVEQPVAADDLDGLERFKSLGICPIVADESCVRLNDVLRLKGRVDGINIKLSKCGGICEALRIIRAARGLGMKIMLGCMVESSLGIAAAVQLAPLADWLDLDGHLLLAHDPFTGIGGRDGRLTCGSRPGLGVERTDEACAWPPPAR